MPALELVLDEIFNIPPAALFPDEPQPTTLAELAAAAGLDLAAVISRIKALQRMTTAIELAPDELQALLQTTAEAPILLDVREPWEYAICHLPGSILLSAIDFAELLPRLRTARRVVAICHHGVRSYSAAMYLRQHGVAHAQSLTGGVDLWSLRIDPALARY